MDGRVIAHEEVDVPYYGYSIAYRFYAPEKPGKYRVVVDISEKGKEVIAPPTIPTGALGAIALIILGGIALSKLVKRRERKERE